MEHKVILTPGEINEISCIVSRAKRIENVGLYRDWAESYNELCYDWLSWLLVAVCSLAGLACLYMVGD